MEKPLGSCPGTHCVQWTPEFSEVALNQKAVVRPSTSVPPTQPCFAGRILPSQLGVPALGEAPLPNHSLRAEHLLCSEAEPSCLHWHMEAISEPPAAPQGVCPCRPQMVMPPLKRPPEPAVTKSKITAEAWDGCHPGLASCAQATAAWLRGRWPGVGLCRGRVRVSLVSCEVSS